MKKPFLLLAALAGVAAAFVKKKQDTQADVALWREATAEDSR